MHRTTVYLDAELDVLVKLEAARSGKTMAEILREALRSYLRQRPKKAPPGAGEFASGRSDTAENAEELLGATGFGRE